MNTKEIELTGHERTTTCSVLQGAAANCIRRVIEDPGGASMDSATLAHASELLDLALKFATSPEWKTCIYRWHRENDRVRVQRGFDR